jgi:hypothetical protein
MWGLWWTKRHWGRFSPSTAVSPANHSTNFSIIIITRGWHNRPISGRSAEWTLDSTPHYTNLKIKKKSRNARIKNTGTIVIYKEKRLPYVYVYGFFNDIFCIYLCICLWLYSPFVGPLPLFQFLNPIHSRWDSLDRGSARRKAATYTQNNTN